MRTAIPRQQGRDDDDKGSMMIGEEELDQRGSINVEEQEIENGDRKFLCLVFYLMSFYIQYFVYPCIVA